MTKWDVAVLGVQVHHSVGDGSVYLCWLSRYTMVWAMGSLSAGHIYRMVTDDGSWQVDFTIPFMIIVQKVTLVAFALHDGE